MQNNNNKKTIKSDQNQQMQTETTNSTPLLPVSEEELGQKYEQELDVKYKHPFNYSPLWGWSKE